MDEPDVLEDQLPIDVDDEDEDEESSEEEIEAAVKSREKRANAGNRMRQLLEDEALEEDEMFKEEEGDQDFEAKDEEDVFDSDFGSTDSGEGEDGEGEDAGEKQLEREAKAARREARGKKKKTTHTPFLPSFARHNLKKKSPVASTSATTLDNDGTATPEAPQPKRRKISLANTIAGMTPRASSRKSAVAFKKTIEERIVENEQKRASVVKPVKKATVTLTQADLIAEALETEEINRASLLAFYAAEEDRRAADRIAGMRYEIYGPKLTFLSRAEGVSRKKKAKEITAEEVAEANARKLESGRRRLIEVVGEYGKQGWKPTVAAEEATAGAAARGEVAAVEGTVLTSPTKLSPPPTPLTTIPTTPKNTDDVFGVDGPTSSQAVEDFLIPPPRKASVAPSSSPPTSSSPLRSSGLALPPVVPLSAGLPSSAPVASTSALPAPPTTDSPPKQQRPEEASLPPGVEPHSRNYLILTDFEGTRSEEMGAFFGEHHEWGSVKVVPSRARVLNRKTPTCVITGLPALYRDPRTYAPYSSVGAYQTLTKVINQAYVWNDTLGAFIGTAGVGIQKEIEKSEQAAAKANGTPTGASSAASTFVSGNASTATVTSTKGKARATQAAETDYFPSYVARVPRKEREPGSSDPNLPISTSSSTSDPPPTSGSTSSPSQSASSSSAHPPASIAKPPAPKVNGAKAKPRLSGGSPVVLVPPLSQASNSLIAADKGTVIVPSPVGDGGMTK